MDLDRSDQLFFPLGALAAEENTVSDDLHD